jgi:hypothetical protein
VFVHYGGSLVADRGMLEAHAFRLQQHVSPLVAGHIWQHDAPHFAAQVLRLCMHVPVPVPPVPALRWGGRSGNAEPAHLVLKHAHVQLERADVPAHVGGYVRFGDSIEVLLIKFMLKP